MLYVLSHVIENGREFQNPFHEWIPSTLPSKFIGILCYVYYIYVYQKEWVDVILYDNLQVKSALDIHWITYGSNVTLGGNEPQNDTKHRNLCHGISQCWLKTKCPEFESSPSWRTAFSDLSESNQASRDSRFQCCHDPGLTRSWLVKGSVRNF